MANDMGLNQISWVYLGGALIVGSFFSILMLGIVTPIALFIFLASWIYGMINPMNDIMHQNEKYAGNLVEKAIINF
jgi:hypothetical protein